MIRDDIISNVLKAKLLLSDYTMTDNAEDKDTFLTLIREYLDALEDPKISLVFDRICLSDGREKDLYTEILTDLLSKLETSLHITTDIKEA